MTQSTPDDPKEIAKGGRRGRPAGQRDRPPAQRRADRAKIKAWSLHGVPVVEIATRLGLTVRTVRAEIAAISREWAEGAIRDFNTALTQQLERIDLIEREAYEGLLRATEPGTTMTTTVTRTAKGTVTSTTKRTVSRTRASTYLARMAKCVEQRWKILGMNKRGSLSPRLAPNDWKSIVWGAEAADGRDPSKARGLR